MDLMALAAVAAANTPSQNERFLLRNLIRTGNLGVECADIRLDRDFDNAALQFVLDSVGPLASAVRVDVGASRSRQRGWIDGWKSLAGYHPECADAPRISSFYFAIEKCLDRQPSEADVEEFLKLAVQVQQDYTGPDSGANRIALEHYDESNPDEEYYEDEFENTTTIFDEFTTFLNEGEIFEALGLIAPSLIYVQFEGDQGADQTVSQLLATSADIIREYWNDATELNDLRSRLWVSSYEEAVEAFGDSVHESLELPRFEVDKPELSNMEKELLQRAVIRNRVDNRDVDRGIVVPPGDTVEELCEPDKDDSFIENEDASEALEIQATDRKDNDSTFQRVEPLGRVKERAENALRASLIASAQDHIRDVGGFGPQSANLAEIAVAESHRVWLSHATVTSTWADNPSQGVQGYGRMVRADLERWASSVAVDTHPLPVDTRPVPSKRSRRFYEHVLAWMVTAFVLGIFVQAHDSIWWFIGIGGGLGWLFSSNYNSIPTPQLAPIPDDHRGSRAVLGKALVGIGLHVAAEYDKHRFSPDLSPAALRQLVHGFWQPLEPPPSPMSSCNPREAEYIAAQWMRFLGATECRVTQATRDGGADVVSAHHVAEVKHRQAPVGVSFVRQIFGVAASTSKHALFFSLGGYTSGAIDFANDNSISLFQYDPFQGTISPRSRLASDTLERGLASISC